MKVIITIIRGINTDINSHVSYTVYYICIHNVHLKKNECNVIQFNTAATPLFMFFSTHLHSHGQKHLNGWIKLFLAMR